MTDIADRLAAGIIPARAGFTRRSLHRIRIHTDHPRSRGVYPTRAGRRGGRSGSSPLARGLRRPTQWENPVRRIIPARAGFTHHGPGLGRPHADHPRSRGVYSAWSAGIIGDEGSSPLARGLRRAAPRRGPPRRIIPARAGFTERGGRGRPARGDHPRSRGVYWDGIVTAAKVAGSSPLARGLPYHQSPREALRRIIPARAGFT